MLARIIVGNNYHIAVLPTVVFVTLLLATMISTIVVTDHEGKIFQNTDAVVICGIGVIAVLLNSPLSFVIAVSVLIIVPQNIQDRKWNYLFLNFGTIQLSNFAFYSTLLLLNLNVNNTILSIAVKIGLAALAYSVCDYLLLAFSYVAERKTWKEIKLHLTDSRNALTESLALSIVCGLLGYYYLTTGSTIFLVFILPIIIGPELYRTYAKLNSSQAETIQMLIDSLEVKDKYTKGHVERVGMFAKYIGQELNFRPYKLKRLHQAALLHDTGKLIVPNALLNKPGKLTDAEYAIVKKHEGVTEEILSAITFLKPIAHTAGGDHNKIDKAIDVKNYEPYIVSVCDAFGAMTSSRSYRKALTQKEAFSELENNIGKQFNGTVVGALKRALEKRDETYGAGFETDIIHTQAPIAGVGSAGIGDTIKDDEGKEE